MKIRVRILLWFLIPFALITTIEAVCFYVHARKTIEQNIFNQLEIAAVSMQENIQMYLESKRGRTIDFSSDGFIREVAEKITLKEGMIERYASALNHHLIANKKSLDPGIHEVLVVDLNDRVIASTDKGRVGEIVSVEKYLSEEIFSGTSVGEPYYDARLQEMLIDYSAVLLSSAGREPLGVLVNRIKIGQRGDRIRDGKSAVQDTEKNNQDILAVNKTRTIDFSSDGLIRDTTEELVRIEEMAFYHADLLNTYLYENKQSLDPDLLAVFVVNLDGEIISSTEIGQTGRNVSGEAYFTKTMETGSCISDLYHTADSRQKTFFNVARLFANETTDKTTGIIVNRYRGDYLKKITYNEMSDILRKAGPLEGLGETGELYIVNSDKLMITESRFIKDAVFKQVVDTKGIRAAFENGRGMIGVYPDYRDIPVLGASRYFKELDWVLLVEKDAAEAFAPLVSLRNVTLLAGFMGIMVFSAVAVFISRGITRPINNLVTHTQNITKGVLSKQIRIKRKDEIGSLGRSFETMRKRLVRSFRRIEDARRDWEITFDSVKDMIAIYDKDYILVKCNHTFLNKLSVKPEDVIGKKCHEIFNHDENVNVSECPVIDASKTLEPVTREIKSSLLQRIFIVSCFPRFNDNGDYIGVVQVMRDITEEKLAQEELVLSHKMASIGQLTAGVVHEVLNPLNIISSHIQLMLTEAEKGSETEEDLKSIREEIARIVNITDGLLRFSRKEEAEAGEVDTNSLLEKIISIVAPDMKLINIKFIREFEEGLPEISANSEELRQVFLNLITNARDAMPEGGTLTVRTRKVRSKKLGVHPPVPIRAGSEEEKDSELRTQHSLPDPSKRQAGKLKGDSVRISFEDTGSGIPKEKLDSVFVPFFTTKKVGKGTGLGMSISYGIVKNHGGTLSVESEKGKGTKFTIDLPC